jgi:hypothetical protein
VDDGGGWLIFPAPPIELAVHPDQGRERTEGQHTVFLMGDDIERHSRVSVRRGLSSRGGSRTRSSAASTA